ncbi:MAG: RNA polymerase sigma factor [Clostridia bacterium]|nr:RNA polymerase sigma factor [Clostridia bacterium]
MKKREIDAMLRRIAKGDNNAFEKLYIETKQGVYAFLYSYFNNQTDCEDAMQTVYLKIKTSISQYTFGTNGLAWILQIAKNTALNEIRANINYQKLKSAESRAESVSFENVVLKDSLMSTMKRVLDEEEQRIIILHVIWSYKHKEIAEILNCPIGTVTSKYKRAIDKMQKTLKEVR